MCERMCDVMYPDTPPGDNHNLSLPDKESLDRLEGSPWKCLQCNPFHHVVITMITHALIQGGEYN